MKPSGIVHIFAALHAAVTIACLEAGISDELFLTILTMAMIILVCLKKNLNRVRGKTLCITHRFSVV